MNRKFDTLFRIKLGLYHVLVEKNELVKKDYLAFVEKRISHSYLDSLKEVARLNMKYVILRRTPLKRYSKLKYPETNQAMRPDLNVILDKALQADIVSFDIFDTLVLRVFDEPEDLFILLGNKLGIANFRYLRREAEKEARRQTKKKSSEIDIWDVYRILEKWCNVPCEIGVKEEALLEQQFCFVNPYMKEFFEVVKKHHKRIILTSDMYLTTDLLEALLAHCGIEGYEKIFVSCECQCNKSSGELQKYIKSQFGEKLSYFHIGDNYQGDVCQSQKSGWNAEYYPKVKSYGEKYRPYKMSRLGGSVYKGLVNSWFYAECEKRSLFYEFGFRCGGILAIGFCKWLNHLAKVQGFDKFIFVARDGDIISRIYEKYFKTIDYQYIQFSRMASEQIVFEDFTEEYIQHVVLPEICENDNALNLIELLNYLGLQDLAEKMDRDVFDCEKILSREDYIAVRHIFYLYKEEIQKEFALAASGAKKYFREMLGESHNVCVVDVGWRGTSVAYMKYLLEKKYGCDVQVSGAMLGAGMEEYPEGFLAEGTLWTYVFSEMKNHIIAENICASQDNILCIELLFSSIQPTLLRYGIDDKGECCFVYKARNEMKEEIEQIQNGIMDFVTWYFQRMGSYANTLSVYPEDAIAPVLTVLSNREYVKELTAKCQKRANARHGFEKGDSYGTR